VSSKYEHNHSKKGYLEVTFMLHCQVSYQVHSNPCSTDGTCLKDISTKSMSDYA
jgi:hypothetical protein